MSLTVHTAGLPLPFPTPDIYFTQGYGLAEERAGAGSWVSLSDHDGRWQLPVHIRDVDGRRDAVSPYGYSGVFADPLLTERDREAAWTRARHELRDRGILSLFLRQSPLLPSPFSSPPGRAVVDGHQTVVLSPAATDLAWADMQGRCRTSIRKAERSGLAATVEPVAPVDLASGSPFRQLYEGAMRRRNAAERYFFTDSYYDTLAAELGNSVFMASARDGDGTVVAAALLLRHGHLLHYHLSGASPDAGSLGATNLLLWAAIQWASAQAIESFHLGGGIADGDSLFKFKRSFGGELLRFSAYGVVVDERGYETAVRERAVLLGRAEDDLRAENFFPQFRVGA